MKRALLLLVFLFLLGSEAFAAQDKKVDVFVTSWCPYCRKLQEFLDKNHIEYSRHDVEKDEAAGRVFERLNGRGVPLVRVGDEVIHGYDPDRVLEALQKS